MSIELKPCPFCGGAAESGTLFEQGMGDSGHHYAGCSDVDCIAFRSAYDFCSVQTAADAWNQRAATQPAPIPAQTVAWWDRAVGGFYLSEGSIPKSAIERGGVVALCLASRNSALHAEPAADDLALRADFDAFLASTQGIVTGEKWPSIEVKKAWMVWQACADALATRGRAEGGNTCTEGSSLLAGNALTDEALDLARKLIAASPLLVRDICYKGEPVGREFIAAIASHIKAGQAGKEQG